VNVRTAAHQLVPELLGGSSRAEATDSGTLLPRREQAAFGNGATAGGRLLRAQKALLLPALSAATDY